jgi:hypothetical protein
MQLHRKLEALLGVEEANTRMAHLPPVNWHEVATKDDLRALESVMRSDFRAELAGVRADFHQSMIEQTRWIVGFICGWSAVVVTIARLLL